MAQDNFFDGYIDGWQSVKPDSIPRLPALQLPDGVSPYDYGFELGRVAAVDANIGGIKS